jgi:hypothetical protein
MSAVPSTQNLGELVSALAHQLKGEALMALLIWNATFGRTAHRRPSLEPPLWKPAE